MANWLGNPENIAQGWGPAPKLDAPSIGGLVSAILANRLARDKMSQEGIADAIRNVREERQSAEYLEAMKAAGLVPQDYEAGGLGGAKLGTGLAEMIQRKNEFEAREEHRRAMEARPTGRGSRGGSRGDGGVPTQVEAPEGHYGLSVAPGLKGPEIIERDGIKYEVNRTKAGIRYKRVPYQTGRGDTTTAPPEDKLAEELKKKFGMTQEELNPPGYAQLPGGGMAIGGEYKAPVQRESKKGGLYAADSEGEYINVSGRRMKYNDYLRLGGKFGTPQPAPAETGEALPTTRPKPVGSDKAGGHAEDYGVRTRVGVENLTVGQTRDVAGTTYVWTGTKWVEQER